MTFHIIRSEIFMHTVWTKFLSFFLSGYGKTYNWVNILK